MILSKSGKERGSSGLRAWRPKSKGASVEQIVVFDPSERGACVCGYTSDFGY